MGRPGARRPDAADHPLRRPVLPGLDRPQQGPDPAGRRAAAAAGQPDRAREPRRDAAAAVLVLPARREGRRRDDRRRPRLRRHRRPVRLGELASARPGCNVDDWECVRQTSYIYPNTGISDAAAAAYEAQGFEIGVHVNTDCADWTPSSLEGFYSDQLAAASRRTSRASPRRPPTAPTASPGATGRRSRRSSSPTGIRLDTNYYYWPAAWVQDRPGYFTGSGMPMRFADLDGSMIDVYQAATQMTDESGLTYAHAHQHAARQRDRRARLLRRRHRPTCTPTPATTPGSRRSSTPRWPRASPSSRRARC